MNTEESTETEYENLNLDSDLETQQEVDQSTDLADDFEENSNKESVEDSVKKALDELENQNATEISTEEAVEQSTEQEEYIPPPQRFTAEGKEWFSSLDTVGKKEILKTVKDLEKHYTKSWQEAAELKHELELERQQVKNLIEAAKPHYETWGIKGLTPEQAVAQLCAFQSMTLRDPDQALLALAASVGRNITIEGYKSPINEPQKNYVDPTIQELKNELNLIKSEKLQAQIRSVAEPIDHELESLKETISPLGRYVFPDFHDEDFVAKNVGPLAETILRNQPDVSPRELLIRAYVGAGGRVIQDPSPQASLSGKIHSEKAKRASLSSQSRQFNTLQMPDEIPSKPEDTVRLAMNMLGM